MLDAFRIFTDGGVVLWSRLDADANTSAGVSMESLINQFVNDVFIEETEGPVLDNQPAAKNTPYKTDQHTIKWAYVKELQLNFVAVYRSILQLSWVEQLIDNLKTIFIDLYADQVKKQYTTKVACQSFGAYYDQQIRELATTEPNTKRAPDTFASKEEQRRSGNLGDEPPLPPLLKPLDVAKQHGSTVDSSSDNSRPPTPGGGAGPTPKLSRKQRKLQNQMNASSRMSGDEGAAQRAKKDKKGDKKGIKKGRVWDADGLPAEEEDDDIKLDYSNDAEGVSKPTEHFDVDPSKWGSMTSKGQFVLKDIDDEVHDILATSAQAQAAASESSKGAVSSGLKTIGGLFRNVVGGKTLTEMDLDAPMKGMKNHLITKNVAPEAAERLCQSVHNELIGTKTGNFEMIGTRVKKAMEVSLTRMLTPSSSLDLLREIDDVIHAPTKPGVKRRPYVMSLVGVNGVGKSTNLAKICAFLLQNKYKVLIAASDTFRSGAIEQLKVHVNNLKAFTEREGGKVALYAKEYGSDAAKVAAEAVKEATQQEYDVVLIDTAGRQANNERLMSNLEKFARLAKPDKILMVGEALTGTDSVTQARNFNSAFGKERRLDGFIISKCDTVGNSVGTLVSIVFATNVPIVFVGTGQHYSDIRNFSVRWAVEKLMSDSNI